MCVIGMSVSSYIYIYIYIERELHNLSQITPIPNILTPTPSAFLCMGELCTPKQTCVDTRVFTGICPRHGRKQYDIRIRLQSPMFR